MNERSRGESKALKAKLSIYPTTFAGNLSAVLYMIGLGTFLPLLLYICVVEDFTKVYGQEFIPFIIGCSAVLCSSFIIVIRWIDTKHDDEKLTRYYQATGRRMNVKPQEIKDAIYGLFWVGIALIILSLYLKYW